MPTVTLRPSADTADAAWTRLNSGIGHYQNVNVAVPADDFSKGVFALSGGLLDVYEVPDDVPAGAASISVEVFVRATQGGDDTEHLSIACKSGASVSTPEEKDLTAGGGTYATFSTVFATNPAGGAWTPATVNAMKIGPYTIEAVVNNVIVDQVWAVVTYTVPFAATGSPNLPHLTAVVAAKLTQKATGAPTLPHLTSVGSGLMKPKGTSASVLPHLIASATGGQGKNVGFVVVTLPHLTALASGYEKPIGTIDVRLPHLTAVVAGTMQPKATGAPSLPHLTAAAAGLFKYTATAAPTLPHLRATATGLKGAAVGKAAPTLAHLIAAVAGKQKQTSSGAGVLGHLVAAATGGVPERATGAVSLPHLTAASNGIFHFRPNFAPNAGGRVYS